MCGINLAFGKDNVEYMNDIIGCRGIRSKVKQLGNTGMYLGHVRLPIQGVDEEHDHPQQYKNIIGAHVGEVFNYKKFGDQQSDLPIILRGYSLIGEECFEYFDGFWSAVIFDEDTELIHIYTDPLAKKPLYIRDYPIAVSSEIKSLILPSKENSFDEVYFSSVAKWGYCPESRTPFNGIIKIPMGAHFVIDAKNQQLKSIDFYTTLNDMQCPGYRRHDLYACMEDSIKNRTVSDVPISMLLSGGLDSTIIYYLLSAVVQEPLTIFHVENDESKYLDYIRLRPKDEIVMVDINKDDYDIEDVLWTNDGPVDLGSMIPQYLLGREISTYDFNVCISGDGADELFGGYKRAQEYDSQKSDVYHELVYYHLPRLDKMMSAHKVELRCPFLSWAVIQNAFNIPYEERINKKVLKDVFCKIVPDEILHRQKQPLRYRPDHLNRNKLIEIYKNTIKKRGLI